MMYVRSAITWWMLIFILFPGVAAGAGFQVPEQGVAPMGMGMAAIGRADDLSAIYHNPAGLAQSPGTRVYGTLTGISASASYTRLGFEAQENADNMIPVPFAAFSTDFQGRLSNAVLAFAMNAPFGLANEYDEAGPQRYLTTNISLSTLYLGPYIGWQLHPMLSIGGGLQYVYATAEIGQHINYGGFLSPALHENAQFDGVLNIKDATDNGFAGNIGILFQPVDALRVGLTWRSGIDLDITGKANVHVPAAVTQMSGGLIQSNVFDGEATIALPQNVGGGIAFQPTPPVTLVADVNWINWSVYNSLDFNFSPDAVYLPDTTSPRNWDDTFAVRCGAEYVVAGQYAVRAGYLFDQSPIPDDTLGPELPGGDRHGLTLGGGFRGQRLTVDVAYAHLFIADRSVTTTLRDSFPLGDYESSANIVGISVGYAF